ncbi:MAG: nicotinate phosphoribosyltransferase [Chloroflexota bacterium]
MQRPSGLSNALFADLYELTMAQAYWQAGRTGPATFSLFFRNYGPDRAYAVVAGLEEALEYMEALAFSDEDVAYLRGTGLFQDAFCEYLRDVRFTGSVRAMAEGEVAFADEPVLEVEGPIIEAQLVETFLMNTLNVHSVLATKASRVVHAAAGRAAVEFAARRTHGQDAADRLARASYIAGFAATSNVLAAARYGIPPAGTMAHSFIMSFPSEREAFMAYAASFPDTATLLVDTYDTAHGVANAIEAARWLRERGHALRAVRLDSGDLGALSRQTRAMLDEAGFPEVTVFASGGLDEFSVDALMRAGAPIAGFGVGTKLGVAADAPWMDWAYKLVAHDGQPALKLSTGKATLPGPKQVYRRTGFGGDVIALAHEPAPAGTRALLAEVLRDGKRRGPQEPLSAMRERFATNFAALPPAHKALREPARYPVAHSAALDALATQVTQQVRAQELGE